MATIDEKTRKADARGRIALGPEYSDREVQVVIIDDDRSKDEQDDKQRSQS